MQMKTGLISAGVKSNEVLSATFVGKSSLVPVVRAGIKRLICDDIKLTRNNNLIKTFQILLRMKKLLSNCRGDKWLLIS